MTSRKTKTGTTTTSRKTRTSKLRPIWSDLADLPDRPDLAGQLALWGARVLALVAIALMVWMFFTR